MAAPYNPPVKNEDFVLYVALSDVLDSTSLKANPTIAAGDWKISKDGGAEANLTTLPVVTPASGVGVKITLSATEMNADNVSIIGIDQTATKEWCDFYLSIPTTA
jgi:alcohol dehydrogenase YqhD (iron-dependent ADH family)